MSRKTLSQIMKQTSWTGADVGKAEVMSFVNYLTGKEPRVSSQDISIMEDTLYTISQKDIYQAYKNFKIYLEKFYNLKLGSLYQFYDGIKQLLLKLYSVKAWLRRYQDYLMEPLILSEKEYLAFREKTREAYYKEKMDLEELVRYIILGSIGYYKRKEALGPVLSPLKPIFTKYQKTKYDTQDTIKKEDLEADKLISLYAETYNVYKDMKNLLPFLLDRLKGLDIEKIKIPTIIQAVGYVSIKDMRRNIKKTLADLEKEPSDIRNDFLRTLILADLEKHPKELALPKKPAKTDKLEVLIYALKDNKPVDEMEKIFPDVALFETILAKGISKGHSPNKKYTIRDLTDLEIDVEELFGLANATEQRIFNSFIGEGQKLFVKRTKAKRGICVAPKGTQAPDIPKWVLELDVISPDGHTIDTAEIDKNLTALIRPALKTLYGINAIFDTFGDILKVDLAPIKTDMEDKVVSWVDEYNKQYREILKATDGEGNTREKNQLQFMTTFPRINLDEYRLDPVKIKEIKDKLAKMELKESISTKHFVPFLTGGGVTIEQ